MPEGASPASSPAAWEPIAGPPRSPPPRLAVPALVAAALHGLLAIATILGLARQLPQESPLTVELVLLEAPSLSPAAADPAAPAPSEAVPPDTTASPPPAMPVADDAVDPAAVPPPQPQRPTAVPPAKTKAAEARSRPRQQVDRRLSRPRPATVAAAPAVEALGPTVETPGPAEAAASPTDTRAETSAPPPQAVAAPPAPPPPATPAAPNLAGYRQGIIRRLAVAKRYPGEALSRGEQGRAVVRIVLDRQGAVVRWSLVEGTGSPRLDREVSALVERAAPYPPLPAGFPRDTIEIVAPIEFALR